MLLGEGWCLNMEDNSTKVVEGDIVNSFDARRCAWIVEGVPEALDQILQAAFHGGGLHSRK
jgi:hypothetical protein